MTSRNLHAKDGFARSASARSGQLEIELVLDELGINPAASYATSASPSGEGQTIRPYLRINTVRYNAKVELADGDEGKNTPAMKCGAVYSIQLPGFATGRDLAEWLVAHRVLAVIHEVSQGTDIDCDGEIVFGFPDLFAATAASDLECAAAAHSKRGYNA